MSIQAVAWVLDHSLSRGLARLVLISLANHAHKDTAECYPSQRTIAAEAGVSLGAVSDCIQNLIKLGEVVVLESGGPRKSARYQIPGVQRSGDEHNSRSPDERSARSKSERSVHSRGEQNRNRTIRGEEETPPPVPARVWAEKWAQLRGVTLTRSVLKAWIPKVQEFIAAGGVPSDELLKAARSVGIESPGGWGFVKPEAVAEMQRLVEHEDCKRCKGKGVIEEYAPGAGMTAVRCDA